MAYNDKFYIDIDNGGRIDAREIVSVSLQCGWMNCGRTQVVFKSGAIIHVDVGADWLSREC